MKSDIKWFMMPLIAVAITNGIYFSVKAWAEAIESKTAMENGYEQVIEDGEKLWKPRMESSK